MRKILLLAVAIVCATTAWSQVLYSISGNGAKKKSYIVGTHHLVDKKFAKEIPGLDKAMKETQQVYGELKMIDMSNPDTIKLMQEAMKIPDGKTIKDLLDSTYFEKLNNLFKNFLGIAFDNPAIYAQMGSLKPSVLESQIVIIMYMAEHPGAFDPTSGLDTYLQMEALGNKKDAKGLESFKFQVELMYQSKTLEEEINSFKCTIDNIETGKKQINMLTEAYNAQNAGELEKILKMQNELECADPEAMENLIDKRNANWIKQMPDIMREKPTLFVVGAGHLFGEKGVLKLLENAGYKVKAVTK